MRIDLHVHTTASDGTLTPSEAVFHARELGLSAIAVTDHDSCDGVAEALRAGEAHGVEVVPGIEISVEWHGEGVHLLGYYVNQNSDAMGALLQQVIDERTRRNELIAASMRADGLPVHIAELEARHPGAVVGRPHFAQALVDLGRAQSVAEAFDRYLSPGGRYYRKREYIPIAAAFDAIRGAGGKAVIAHPFQYRLPEHALIALTRTLTDAGAVGMECIYTGYNAQQTEYLRALAADFGLCITGGSDFHGAGKPENRMGEPAVDYELLQILKEV